MPLKLGKLGVILVLSIFSFVNRLHGKPLVPCYFVFGDSLNDNGNNNNIKSQAKANYLPYGIDFPDGPSGRFSNGKNFADIIVEFMGFNSYIPPFLYARGKDILRGVNYASGGAGILDDTDKIFGNISPFRRQLKHHLEIVSKIKEMLGGDNETSALSHLSKCFYHVQIGNTDYLGNYFSLRNSTNRRRYNPEQFAELLIQTYTERIRTLHQYGARKMALVGVGPIGCTPILRARDPFISTPCVERYHAAIEIYNDRLKSLVNYLNSDYSDSKFIYVDTFNSFQELVLRPQSNGFAVVGTSCCGFGIDKGHFTCLPHQIPCRKRDQYLFWDPFHLTEAGNLAAVKKLFSNDTGAFYTYPMTILQLAEL